jgi:general secretion pathway protein G
MRGSGGFTLIELILVTVIIGILAGMVALNLSGRVQDAQIKAAKGDIATYNSAIDLYALDHSDQLPKSLDDLVKGSRKYVKELRNDPWGNPYVYKVASGKGGNEYTIFSAGPDGTPNTDDDVTSTSEHGVED